MLICIFTSSFKVLENKLGTVIRINESSLLILEFKTFYGVPFCILLYRNCFDVDIFHFSGFSLSQTVLTSYCTFYFTMVKYFPNLPIYNERWLLFSYNSPIFKIRFDKQNHHLGLKKFNVKNTETKILLDVFLKQQARKACIEMQKASI